MNWLTEFRKWLTQPAVLSLSILATEESDRVTSAVCGAVTALSRQCEQDSGRQLSATADLGIRLERIEARMGEISPFSLQTLREWECVRYACEKLTHDPETGTTDDTAVAEWAVHYAREQGWTIRATETEMMYWLGLELYEQKKAPVQHRN